jgi:hypothetical protein
MNDKFILFVLFIRLKKRRVAYEKYKLKYPERIKKAQQEYYLRNRESRKAYSVAYTANNPEIKRAQYNRAHTKRMSQTHTRLKHNLRGRIWSAITGNKAQYKLAGLHELIGCTIPEYKQHLEKQFKAGMTWENYGEWHVDHIVPCAVFDLTQREQQLECFNFKNTQPLWALDNLKKYSK